MRDNGSGQGLGKGAAMAAYPCCRHGDVPGSRGGNDVLRRLLDVVQTGLAPRPCIVCEVVHIPEPHHFEDEATGLPVCPSCLRRWLQWERSEYELRPYLAQLDPR
jgi:hypothetical protein